MKSTMKVLFSFALSLSVMWTVGECSGCSKNHPISEIVNHLSSKLALEIGGKGNYFISPLSISVALAMVYLGAHGKTKSQMTNALRYQTLSEECVAHDVSKSFKELLETLSNTNDHYKFLVANAGFVQQGFNVLPDYISNLQKFFNAKVESLDFANEAELSLEKVNEWVSNYTNGHISNLLSDPLDPLTIMVLLNAVYFKGLWHLPFDERMSWKSFFYYTDGTSKTVSYMVLQDMLKYYHDPETNHSFVELDYAGQKVSMLIALPNANDQFPNIDLNGKTLCRIRSELSPHNVVLVMPKFKMEYKRELSKIMINMGITELFSDRADLTGIRPENDLHVSLMIHKAMVEVNEQGSEASGVSGAGIAGRRRPSEQIAFWVDHAFVFCILDKRSGAILFSGRVADPEF